MEMIENLNLSDAKRDCILKALNKARQIKAAGVLCGVSERTMHRYIRSWDIFFNTKTEIFEIRVRPQKAIPL